MSLYKYYLLDMPKKFCFSPLFLSLEGFQLSPFDLRLFFANSGGFWWELFIIDLGNCTSVFRRIRNHWNESYCSLHLIILIFLFFTDTPSANETLRTPCGNQFLVNICLILSIFFWKKWIQFLWHGLLGWTSMLVRQHGSFIGKNGFLSLVPVSYKCCKSVERILKLEFENLYCR